MAFPSAAELCFFTLPSSLNLLPRILCWVRQASWLVVSDILDAEILEYLEQGLTYVRECYGSVVWITLLNQYVTIEAAHLVDGGDTDTTE